MDEEEQDTGDPEFIKRQEQKRSELDEQLKEYIAEWRMVRVKEQEELKRLKEKQAKRKVARADEEKAAAERKKQEEERRVKEIEEKKVREAEEKKQRLIEAEKKRQAMMAALKEQHKNKTLNLVVKKKALAASLSDAELERTKTKEQLEEEKKISLSIRIKPLQLDGMSTDKLKERAQELWEAIVKLETEKYDLEEREKRQEYDLKELKERQRQQLRHKALKKGLDPEALTGPHPPKIQLASKYERRVDIRSFDDKQKLFQGGFDMVALEQMEKNWREKMDEFSHRPRRRLPKWCGERPGKKPGDPDTPEEEEIAKAVDDEVDELIKEPQPAAENEEEDLEEEEVEVDEEEEDDEDDEDEEEEEEEEE
ncbi:troponin T-like [Sitophilus oryzae]|uniref:Troponin T-like n=1 Tax=Sitophilus oryzae TaxID=7048 RepID=A0A6J2XXB5_SITOR|nr:troponin T-like [Sitophilus oryzae]